MNRTVRPPSRSELAALWSWLKAEQHVENYLLHESSWYQQFYIAVFDNYITGSPGYCGRVLYLIWDGGVEQIDVFIFRDRQLIHVGKHHEDCTGFFRK